MEFFTVQEAAQYAAEKFFRLAIWVTTHGGFWMPFNTPMVVYTVADEIVYYTGATRKQAFAALFAAGEAALGNSWCSKLTCAQPERTKYRWDTRLIARAACQRITIVGENI
jgi:hypothetical protein